MPSLESRSPLLFRGLAEQQPKANKLRAEVFNQLREALGRWGGTTQIFNTDTLRNKDNLNSLYPCYPYPESWSDFNGSVISAALHWKILTS